MRRSKPYTEVIDGLSDVRAGDLVERDDGWWRAVLVTTYRADGDAYRTDVLWRPEPKPRPPETDLSRITWLVDG